LSRIVFRGRLSKFWSTSTGNTQPVDNIGCVEDSICSWVESGFLFA